MRSALRTVFTALILIIACGQSIASCNWVDLARYTYFWDTCTVARKSLNGYVNFNSSACFKYQWSVNGVPAGTGPLLNYPVTQNGTYRVCLAVIDSCNQCDTVICSSRVINCTSPPGCTWTSNPYAYYWETCTGGQRSLNGTLNFANGAGACYKYKWKVNGAVVGTGQTFTYPVQQNGSYNVCVSIVDSCNSCDTTICAVRVVNCPPPACSWSSSIHPVFWDSCTATGRSLNGYVSSNSWCMKYQWKVNGANAGTGNILHYPVQQNGTYNVCVAVIDSCNRCDTVICSTRVINCTTPPRCNWTNIQPVFWDTCTSANKSLNGYVPLPNTAPACYKYVWRVNGNVVGTGRELYYPVTSGGPTFNVCVTVIDTCNGCDTTFCSIRVLNCPPRCNWGNIYTTFWDTCTVAKKSLNGYISYGSNAACYKYRWKVNGVVVDEDRTLNYPVTQNGTYNVCVAVIDSCNRCDTVICSTRVINCTSPPRCTWTSNPYAYYWETCTAGQRSLNGTLNFANGAGPCFKYKWKVNGAVVGTGLTFSYPVQQNGTYNVCVSIIDSCNSCDTTICAARIVNCPPPACNWSTNIHPVFWDSCTNTGKWLNGYVSSNSHCLKYQWKVNGVNVGTGNTLHYPVQQNGTYNVCVAILDSCNRCDTVICSTRVINCTTPPRCNWASKHPTIITWDSCTTVRRSLNAYVRYDPNTNTSCYKYRWKVNGVVVSTQKVLNYPVTQNGTYNICVSIIDSCNSCDTTLCIAREFNCTLPRCNFASRHPNVSFWDTCTAAKKSLNGYISFPNTLPPCYKYTWKVNGNVVGTGRTLNYPVYNTVPYTYNVCVTVTDTCNGCDTTFCSIRVLNCPPQPCNWANKHPTIISWDSCSSARRSINALVRFDPNTNTSCYKYRWKINGTIVSTQRELNYPVTTNGTYNICVSIIDSCNSCDTTLCITKTFNCGTPHCNWANANPTVHYWENCSGAERSVNGYISFNSNASCFKYKWKVNGVVAGTGRVLNYPVTQNGTYNVCVTVTDTCNGCDTTFCSIRVLSCPPAQCWSTPVYTYFWDSCTVGTRSLNAYINPNSTSSCIRYQWKVNGANAGTGKILHYPLTQNGTYEVCVTAIDSCYRCDTVICSTRVINCEDNGIQRRIDPLQVFPNPARGAINLAWLDEAEATYTLLSSTGQVLRSGILQRGLQSLDLSGFPGGIYTIRIQTDYLRLSKKIVLQR